MADETPTFLPLFPLELAVFPEEHLKLHIFEPRYKQLIGECVESGLTFGIPPFHERQLASYGTELRVVEVFRTYPNGEMDILTLGLRCFQLVRFLRDVPDKLYSGGEVLFLDNDVEDETSAPEELLQHYHRMHELLGLEPRPAPHPGGNFSFRLAPGVGLAIPQKIQLLSLTREADRRLYLLEHLKRVIPMLESARDIRRRVHGNGHFHKLPPLDVPGS